MANTYVPIPIPWTKTSAGSHVPGQQTVAGVVRQWASVPKIVALITLAYAMYEWSKSPARRLAEKGAAICQSKYCTQIHVDKPLNTLLKDQSLGVGLSRPRRLPSGMDVLNKVKEDYFHEQMHSPGVAVGVRAIEPGTRANEAPAPPDEDWRAE